MKPLKSEHNHISCAPIILPRITGAMSSVKLHSVIRAMFKDIGFADPHFDMPGPIDVLLGTDNYTSILKDGGRVIHKEGLPPPLFETVLGWILSGRSSLTCSALLILLFVMTEPSLDQLLRNFWITKEPSSPSVHFTDEAICGKLFQRTTVLDTSFCSEPAQLDDSYNMTLSRLHNLERKLQRDPNVYDEYRKFMHEYIQMGHMKLVQTKEKYFIPHHA